MQSFQKRSILLAFAAALLSIGACVPEFNHPLSDEKTSKIDPQLVGRWEVIDEKKDNGDKNKQTDFWIFSRREGSPNTLEFSEEKLPATTQNGVKHDADKSQDTADAFTTEIDSKRYLSLGGEKDDTKNKGKSYVICRYTISKAGALTVYFMDQETVGQDVAAKKISGMVEYSGKHKNRFDRVRITAEPSDIAKYLKANGDKCFKNDLAIKLNRAAEPAAGK